MPARRGGVAGSRNYRVLCYYTEALYELLAAAATTAKAKTQLIALEEDGVECMSCTETAKLLHFSSSKFLFSMVTSVNYIMLLLNEDSRVVQLNP